MIVVVLIDFSMDLNNDMPASLCQFLVINFRRFKRGKQDGE